MSISPEGVVFSIDKNGKLLRYNGRKFEFVNTKFGLITDLAATTGGGVWLLDQYNNIFVTSGSPKSDNSTYFLSYHVKKTSVKNQTVGSGTALLNGRKLTPRELKLSADAPNGGFIFKKKMRRKPISNTNYFLDLSMGRNGRLWALTSTKVYQYHEKKKSFKIYKKSDFNKKEQEFLKLPVGVTVSSIISDRDDKLWIIKKNSKTLYWQKKRKLRGKKVSFLGTCRIW